MLNKCNQIITKYFFLMKSEKYKLQEEKSENKSVFETKNQLTNQINWIIESKLEYGYWKSHQGSSNFVSHELWTKRCQFNEFKKFQGEVHRFFLSWRYDDFFGIFFCIFSALSPVLWTAADENWTNFSYFIIVIEKFMR